MVWLSLWPQFAQQPQRIIWQAWKEPDENGNIPELTLEEISEFNNKAADAVETYNTYLVKDIKAAETDQINNKITELNEKIKEYTQLYDSKSQEVNNAVSESIKQEEQ